ncbi:hypothetical protein [Actinomadura sp. GTD37]|uniref:hypothetical protein n=1 Tax=Actinomadura sp. GTD37 TaxID=1778030 RepID=UPI0035BEE497
MTAALDVGSATTRILSGSSRTVFPTPPPDELIAALAGALAARGPVVCAVPDHWRDDGEGLARQERLHGTLQRLGSAALVGRFAAVAAEAAMRHGPGAYLVCDAGAAGAGAGLCEVAGESIRLVDARYEPAAGGAAFAEAVAPGRGAPFAEAAAARADRVRELMAMARGNPRYRAARVLAFSGTELTAGSLLDAFAPVAALLTGMLAELAGAAARRPGASPRTVLTGGFAEFPAVADALPDADRLGPHAAVHGAARLAAGLFREAPLPETTLPVHRLAGGRPQQARVRLPGEPGRFASMNGRELLLCHQYAGAFDDRAVPLDSAMTLDGGTLPVEVGGRPASCRTGALPPGAYRIGLRASTRGPAVALFPPDPRAPAVRVPLEGPAS